MLIPFLAYVFIQVLLAALALACIAIIWVRRRRRDPVAVARIDRPTRRFVRRIAPALLLVGALAGMWQLHTHATDVVVIDPDLREVRAIYLGDPDYYEGLPRTVSLRDWRSDPTWIVNRSHRTIQVVPVYYGPEKGQPLGPGELGVASSVDYVGPDDVPPPGGAHHSVFDRGKHDFEIWVTW